MNQWGDRRGGLEVNEFDPSRPAYSYFYIVRRIIGNPRQFYQAMPLTGGFRSPALFVLISFLVPALILALINKDGLSAFLYLAMMGGWLFYVFLLHLTVTKLMSGRGSFQATFRAAAYASFTNLFGFVPFLGLIAHIFGLYLTSQGLVAAHRLKLGTAILAVVLVLAALLAANLLLARAILQSLWFV